MNVRKFYDETAKIYDYRHDDPYTKHLRKMEKKMIKKYVGGFVLDVGGGTGFHSSSVNLDVSVEMIKKSKSKKILGRAEFIPFRDETFDSVICMFSVLNLVKPESVKEIRRVLKKGGVFLASYSSIWDKEYPPIWKRLNPRGEKTKTIRVLGNKLKLRLFSKDFINFVVQNGFEHIETRSVFVLKRPIWNRFEKGSFLLNFDFLGKFLKFSGAMFISVFRKR